MEPRLLAKRAVIIIAPVPRKMDSNRPLGLQGSASTRLVLQVTNVLRVPMSFDIH